VEKCGAVKKKARMEDARGYIYFIWILDRVFGVDNE